MKIAMLMLCHTHPEQINGFISSFDEEYFDFFLHVDRKSNIQSRITNQENVYFVPGERRIEVRWGTYSMVQATLELIDYAIKNGIYDYCWLCSGEDFPIKNSQEIVEFFERKNGCNFISFVSTKNYPETSRTRTLFATRCAIIYPSWIIGKSLFQRLLKKAYVTLTGGKKNDLKLIECTFPEGLTVFFGSQWWCLNWETIKWMNNFISQHQEICEFYKGTLCPDESLFHTLIMNSPYLNNIESNLVYLKWDNDHCSPRLLTDADYEQLMASSKLIARKIDCRVAPELYERLLSQRNLIHKKKQQLDEKDDNIVCLWEP